MQTAQAEKRQRLEGFELTPPGVDIAGHHYLVKGLGRTQNQAPATASAKAV